MGKCQGVFELNMYISLSVIVAFPYGEIKTNGQHEFLLIRMLKNVLEVFLIERELEF